MKNLTVVGKLRSSQAEVEACGWSAISGVPINNGIYEGMFVAYDQVPPERLPAGLVVIGTNTSQPTWIDRRVLVVTTRDERILNSAAMHRVTPTAEFVIGQIMFLHRQLSLAACKSWGDREEFVAPAMLSRMSMLLIGFGRIGYKVAQVAERLFGSLQITDKETEKFLGNNLPSADVVVMTAHTDRCILTAELLDLLKPSALLVSISPPCAINTEKALGMLLTDRLRGLALDCHDLRWNTAMELGTQLIQKVVEGRLLLTPHMAGSTEDARRETEQMVLREMARRIA